MAHWTHTKRTLTKYQEMDKNRADRYRRNVQHKRPPKTLTVTELLRIQSYPQKPQSYEVKSVLYRETKKEKRKERENRRLRRNTYRTWNGNHTMIARIVTPASRQTTNQWLRRTLNPPNLT